MDKTVVSIFALGYSGSHYLSLLIGSHPNAAHLGEVHYLSKKQPDKRKKVCARCGNNDRCPLFHGIGSHNIDQVYEIIFSRLDPSVSVVADNSKDLRWASRFLRRSPFRRKYIHLFRDPRALIRRWMVSYLTRWPRVRTRLKVVRTQPYRTPRLLFADMLEIYIYNWLIRNQQITRFIQHNDLDAYLLTYHDLAQNPSHELRQLMPWIGLAFEPAQLEYWNVDHHGSQRSQYEWIKVQKSQYIDIRWQTYLTQQAINHIVHNPDVNAYLSRMGLAFTDDGITRMSAPA